MTATERCGARVCFRRGGGACNRYKSTSRDGGEGETLGPSPRDREGGVRVGSGTGVGVGVGVGDVAHDSGIELHMPRRPHSQEPVVQDDVMESAPWWREESLEAIAGRSAIATTILSRSTWG